MGLSDMAGDTSGNTSSSTSTSSSSSGRRTKERMPYLVIWYWREDDSWESDRYPATSPIQYEYGSHGWQIAEKLANRKRIVWTEDEYDVLKRRIRDEYEADLDRLVREDPQQALQCIKWAAQQKSASEVDLRPKCAICDERHNRLSGGWVQVGRRVVCGHHPAQDLREHGLLDD